jgi:exodeoxyribonuclease VII large subunit
VAGGAIRTSKRSTPNEPRRAIFTVNTPIVTAIGHTDDRLTADQVADVTTITPTAAGAYIVNSRRESLASEVKPLEVQLEAAYETVQQEHEHELAEPFKGAAAPEGLSPVYYKAAIAVLLLLLLVIIGLWLGVI